MDADELFGIRTGFGQSGDGQGGRVGGKEAASCEHRFRFLRHFGLELAVFKHRFNDQIAVFQVRHVARGLNQIQNLLLGIRLHAAFVHAALGDLGAIAFAQVGLLLADVLQHRGDAFAGLAVGNTRAHHARTQQPHLGRFEAGHAHRTALSAFDSVQVEEEGVNHGLGIYAGHQLGQMAALDAQRSFKVDLQAFDHASDDGLGRRIEAPGLAFDHCGGHHQHLRHGGRRGQAAWHFVTFGFPGMLGEGVGGNPGQRLDFHFGGCVIARGYQVVHQAQAFGLGRGERLAFHQVGLRTHQAQVTRHLGHTAGAGQQAQRHFGQAELGFAVVNGNAVVAD